MPNLSISHLGSYYFIDANCINARQVDQNINQMERWHQEGVISILIPQIAATEAARGSDERLKKSWDYSMLESKPGQTNPYIASLIENIVFPQGITNENQRNDVAILVVAQLYGYPLITNDGASKNQPGGMLGNARALANIGISVLTPRSAVTDISKRLKRREIDVRQLASPRAKTFRAS